MIVSGVIQCFTFTAFIVSNVLSNANIANQNRASWRQDSDVYYQRQRFGIPGFCPSNTQCVPLASCPVLSYDRVGSLGCGYQGSGLICCPSYGGGPPLVNNFGDRCGLSSVRGGNYVGIGSFPFVARVGFRNDQNEMKYPCSGSIISKRVVLTAAHCALAKSDKFKLAAARVGEWTANSDIDCGEEFCALPVQDISISHVVLHPGYQKDIYKDNIALLVLDFEVNYTVTAQPVCLPEAWSHVGNDGTLVGWGKIAGQTAEPPQQQVLELPITSLQQCANIYGRTLPITEYHLCAGGERGRDACTGFGGAPLLERQGDVYIQAGILSFGSDECGAPGIPSVYINVRKYVSWIKDNIPVFYKKN